MAGEQGPFIFEEGGAFSAPIEPERHPVRFDVLAVGPYNLMVGYGQSGELTGDYTILDSRRGEQFTLGQSPSSYELVQAYRQGERIRSTLKSETT